jgi:hypothetical protein
MSPADLLCNIELPCRNGMAWRHYKGGVYFVFGYARNSDFKKEIAVLYFSRGDQGREILWHRELYDWCEMVKWPDGIYRQRFFPDDEILKTLTYPERIDND